MNVDNVKSQMRKGMLEYCVMLLLNEKAYYTSDIIKKLKEADMLVVEGTVYPLLTRLKKDGLLAYNWHENTMGPPRKYYVLTEKGEELLTLLDAEWQDLQSTVNKLKERRLLIESGEEAAEEALPTGAVITMMPQHKNEVPQPSDPTNNSSN